MPEGQKMIMVVDDDPDALDFFTTVLEDHGFATVTAMDGNEALQRLEEGRPDLITLDISMPEKSGVGVYRRLKEFDDYRDIPVIIITGVSDDFKQFISTRKQVPPPKGYLSKPVEAEQLVELVEELLG